MWKLTLKLLLVENEGDLLYKCVQSTLSLSLSMVTCAKCPYTTRHPFFWPGLSHHRAGTNNYVWKFSTNIQEIFVGGENVPEVQFHILSWPEMQRYTWKSNSIKIKRKPTKPLLWIFAVRFQNSKRADKHFKNHLYLSPLLLILAAPAPAWALTTLCWWFCKLLFSFSMCNASSYYRYI